VANITSKAYWLGKLPQTWLIKRGGLGRLLSSSIVFKD